jgi:spore maturation protein CgeB
MKFILYSHSLVSDWNHGNVHFQRGVLRELTARGHDVLALEPAQGWSRSKLFRDQGSAPFTNFHKRFRSSACGPTTLISITRPRLRWLTW